VSGAGALSWCAAILGWAAPLTIGTFVAVGAHHERHYDAWRTRAEEPAGTTAVALTLVNRGVHVSRGGVVVPLVD
jgi:succinate dehydrogenase hydrophobic anchor subunit